MLLHPAIEHILCSPRSPFEHRVNFFKVSHNNSTFWLFVAPYLFPQWEWPPTSRIFRFYASNYPETYSAVSSGYRRPIYRLNGGVPLAVNCAVFSSVQLWGQKGWWSGSQRPKQMLESDSSGNSSLEWTSPLLLWCTSSGQYWPSSKVHRSGLPCFIVLGFLLAFRLCVAEALLQKGLSSSFSSAVASSLSVVTNSSRERFLHTGSCHHYCHSLIWLSKMGSRFQQALLFRVSRVSALLFLTQWPSIASTNVFLSNHVGVDIDQVMCRFWHHQDLCTESEGMNENEV